MDGTKSVVNILSELEDDKVSEAEYVELGMCTQSCFGGCMMVENPYTAKLRMRCITDPIPDQRMEIPRWLEDRLDWDFELEEIDTEIADTIAQALQIEASAERLLKTLPKFDCGNCGAPTWPAFSRDVAEALPTRATVSLISSRRCGRGAVTRTNPTNLCRRPIESRSGNSGRIHTKGAVL